MKLCRVAVTIAVSAPLLVGCGGSGLPDELSFVGQRVERAADWELGSLKGVVLIPPGEDLDTASLQIGIILGHGPYDAKELHQWVMRHYDASPIESWYMWVDPVDTWACKVGRDPRYGRPFVAIHICRKGPAGTATVEADERLDDSVLRACRGPERMACWNELCVAKRAEWIPDLAAIARDLVRPPSSDRVRGRDRGGS